MTLNDYKSSVHSSVQYLPLVTSHFIQNKIQTPNQGS